MHDQHNGLLIAALSLIAVGLLGAAITAVSLSAPTLSPSGRLSDQRLGDGSPRTRDFASNGERIFLTGVGHEGRILVEWDPSRGRMGPRTRTRYADMGCTDCHGIDGRGRSIGMMFPTSTPDIRYSALTGPHGQAASAGWTDAQIARAVREGVEPDGEELDPMMPRWDMDETDMRDIINYLKELDRR